jgi:hypothetical protein
MSIFAVTAGAFIFGCAKSKYSVTELPKSSSDYSNASTASQPREPRASVDCQAVNEMDFLECMTRKSRCSVADAVRAVGLLMNGFDTGKNYKDRYQFLRDRGIVRDEWGLKPDQWVDRGTLAYMLFKAAKIEGGVNTAIFGRLGIGDRHYAYREMLYHDLIEGGCDYQCVSGPELVTTAGKVDRYSQEYGDYSATRETDLGNKPLH